MYSIVFFVLALGLNVQAQKRCDAITSVSIDFTTVQQNSPWDVMVSSDPNYNCTTAILTGPAPTNGKNYTWVMIQKNTINNVANVGFLNNPQNVRFTTCKGETLDYKFLYFSNTCFITYVCDDAGENVILLRGYGHNATDLATINTILAKPENQFKYMYAGDAKVTDVDAQCIESKICSGFYM